MKKEDALYFEDEISGECASVEGDASANDVDDIDDDDDNDGDEFEMDDEGEGNIGKPTPVVGDDTTPAGRYDDLQDQVVNERPEFPNQPKVMHAFAMMERYEHEGYEEGFAKAEIEANCLFEE
jgi:hypothetical protein